jgi:hypothetical protein
LVAIKIERERGREDAGVTEYGRKVTTQDGKTLGWRRAGKGETTTQAVYDLFVGEVHFKRKDKIMLDTYDGPDETIMR